MSNNFGPKLQGKIALITGAGSGVGRAMAQDGARVVVVDVVPERVAQVVAQLGSNSATG